VQNDKVSAEFKDGILRLTLLKVVEARRKEVVKVNLAAPTTSPDIAKEPQADATA